MIDALRPINDSGLWSIFTAQAVFGAYNKILNVSRTDTVHSFHDRSGKKPFIGVSQPQMLERQKNSTIRKQRLCLLCGGWS